MRKTFVIIAAFTLLTLLGGMVSAQTRVNDKDIETMMKNLNEDVKKFKSSFNSGIGNTSIRKTSREKESKALVQKFEQQTGGMLNQFKKDKKAESQIKLVLRSAEQINQLLDEVTLDSRTVSAWKKVQEALGLLKKGLGVTE